MKQVKQSISTAHLIWNNWPMAFCRNPSSNVIPTHSVLKSQFDFNLVIFQQIDKVGLSFKVVLNRMVVNDLKNKIPYLELLRLLLQDPVLIGILMWKFSRRKIQTIFHQKYPIQNCFFFYF